MIVERGPEESRAPLRSASGNLATGRAQRLWMVFAALTINTFLPITLPAQVLFTVDSVADEVDDNTAVASCHTALGTCTLRAAVMQANHIGNADITIMLPAGVFILGPGVDADGEESGDLNLPTPIGGSPLTTITGTGAAATIIDGNLTDRVFSIAVGRRVNINGVTIRNGKTFGNGAGILNAGVLSLANCVIDHNLPAANYTTYGGGISNDGEGSALTLVDCVISNNVGLLGGGIYHGGDSVVATRVTFSNNQAGSGGAILAFDNLSLDHCTLTGNQVTDSGGAIDNWSDNVVVTFTTLEGNIAGQNGGAIRNSQGELTLTQSTVDGNFAAAGGGIENRGTGTVNVRQSTISSNGAQSGFGGGIVNSSTLFVTSSTISSNSALEDGGGISNSGSVNMYNSTVVRNQADSNGMGGSDGGGLFNGPGATLNIRNTVVAGNFLSGFQEYHDCAGVLGMYGNNKFSPGVGCSVAPGSPGTVTSLESIDELGFLRDNGGPTKTVALVPPSGMIDGAAPCVGQNGGSDILTSDQRGRPRIVGAYCDIGAFEYDAGDIFANGFQ